MKALQQVFRLAKNTNTHADVFATVGLAQLLSFGEATVRITEEPTAFCVTLDSVRPIGMDMPGSPGYPFLKTNEKVVIPEGAFDPVDYKAERSKEDRVRALRRGRSLKALDATTLEAIDQDKPRPDWNLLKVLNVLQGDETANRIHKLIVRMPATKFRAELESALARIVDGKPSDLDWRATSVQLFTPTAAKGYSRLKPDSTDRNDKTKEQWTDSFIEWLRYQGYFAVACPFGPLTDYIRLLCPIPHDISIGALVSAASALRSAGLFGAAPKIDSLAALGLAEILVEHSKEYHPDEIDPFADFEIAGKSPADAISGISITHYQSLGNAKAVSSLSTISLPGWFPLNNKDDAKTMLDILNEHQRIVRPLQDDHSDEIGLLIQYRRFLELRGESAITALIDFMARYGSFVIRVREQERSREKPRRYMTQFSVDNFKRLIMRNAPNLTEILTDPGFKAVADAIRAVTVSAQFQKAMIQREKRGSEWRPIRYDLMPELCRKSSLPKDRELVEALSRFVQSYNYENARQAEILAGNPEKKSWRPSRNIMTDQFSSLVALIETHHAATVGPMLCAYGSCRVSRDGQEDSEGQEGNADAAEENKEV